MGILKTLFRSRDKPQNRTAGSGYSFFFGGTTSGKAVNEMSAIERFVMEKDDQQHYVEVDRSKDIIKEMVERITNLTN